MWLLQPVICCWGCSLLQVYVSFQPGCSLSGQTAALSNSSLYWSQYRTPWKHYLNANKLHSLGFTSGLFSTVRQQFDFTTSKQVKWTILILFFVFLFFLHKLILITWQLLRLLTSAVLAELSEGADDRGEDRQVQLSHYRPGFTVLSMTERSREDKAHSSPPPVPL